MASLAAMMRRVRSSSSGQTALNFCVNPTALELMDRNHGRFQRRLLPLFIYAALVPLVLPDHWCSPRGDDEGRPGALVPARQAELGCRTSPFVIEHSRQASTMGGRLLGSPRH